MGKTPFWFPSLQCLAKREILGTQVQYWKGHRCVHQEGVWQDTWKIKFDSAEEIIRIRWFWSKYEVSLVWSFIFLFEIWLCVNISLILQHLGVSKNRGTPKSSNLISFSIINHPFWGTPIFGNTHIFPWTSGSTTPRGTAWPAATLVPTWHTRPSISSTSTWDRCSPKKWWLKVQEKLLVFSASFFADSEVTWQFFGLIWGFCTISFWVSYISVAFTYISDISSDLSFGFPTIEQNQVRESWSHWKADSFYLKTPVELPVMKVDGYPPGN